MTLRRLTIGAGLAFTLAFGAPAAASAETGEPLTLALGDRAGILTLSSSPLTVSCLLADEVTGAAQEFDEPGVEPAEIEEGADGEETWPQDDDLGEAEENAAQDGLADCQVRMTAKVGARTVLVATGAGEAGDVDLGDMAVPVTVKLTARGRQLLRRRAVKVSVSARAVLVGGEELTARRAVTLRAAQRSKGKRPAAGQRKAASGRKSGRRVKRS